MSRMTSNCMGGSWRTQDPDSGFGESYSDISVAIKIYDDRFTYLYLKSNEGQDCWRDLK